MKATTSMENLADISEPQVPSEEQKDQQIQFFICLSVSMVDIAFLPLKQNKQMKNLIN